MVKLELNFQGLVLKEYTLQDGSSLTIGRHSENDIVVKDRSASRHHAFFERKGESLIVHDKGSRNGTFVNGKKVQSAQVYHGDLVKVGTKLSIKAFITSTKKRESTVTGEQDNIVTLVD
ncbi:MAG: FHA domain-containing protein [Syntrophobacteria bacterium]